MFDQQLLCRQLLLLELALRLEVLLALLVQLACELVLPREPSVVIASNVQVLEKLTVFLQTLIL